MENVKMTKDRVLIRPDEELSKTAGGIIIPNSAKEKPKTGIVVAHGNGCEIKEGDHVYYGFGCGTDITIKSENYLLMREFEILAIII